MTAKRHEFSDPDFWQSPWLDELPQGYFPLFGDYLADTFLPATYGARAPEEMWWRKEFRHSAVYPDAASSPHIDAMDKGGMQI
jgi:hypothetical protein